MKKFTQKIKLQNWILTIFLCLTAFLLGACISPNIPIYWLIGLVLIGIGYAIGYGIGKKSK